MKRLRMPAVAANPSAEALDLTHQAACKRPAKRFGGIVRKAAVRAVQSGNGGRGIKMLYKQGLR